MHSSERQGPPREVVECCESAFAASCATRRRIGIQAATVPGSLPKRHAPEHIIDCEKGKGFSAARQKKSQIFQDRAEKDLPMTGSPRKKVSGTDGSVEGVSLNHSGSSNVSRQYVWMPGSRVQLGMMVSPRATPDTMHDDRTSIYRSGIEVPVLNRHAKHNILVYNALRMTCSSFRYSPSDGRLPRDRPSLRRAAGEFIPARSASKCVSGLTRLRVVLVFG